MLRYTAYDYTTKACRTKFRIFASLYLTDGSLSPQLSFLNKSSTQTRFIAARRKELTYDSYGRLSLCNIYIKCLSSDLVSRYFLSARFQDCVSSNLVLLSPFSFRSWFRLKKKHFLSMLRLRCQGSYNKTDV